MRILISGATGFIGRSLCEALSREGHELVAITRNANRARSLIPTPHKALEWGFSLEKLPKDLSLLENLGAVIHLAGEPILAKRWSPSVQKALYDSRVSSTRNLEALLKGNCRKFPEIFISASAIGYYGDRGDEILDETAQKGTDFLAKLCSDWEQVLLESGDARTRKIALRLGIVLGKNGGALEKMLRPFSLGLGGTLGSGAQWMSWIHLNDLVGVIEESLKRDNYSGAINCCTPNPLTNREFTATLAKHLNTKAVFQVPKIGLKWIYGQGSQVLLSSQRINPAKLLANHYHFKYPSLDFALSHILGR